MPKALTFIEYTEDGDEVTHTLPHVWAICSHCRGEGKSSAYLGAFTADEMYEEGPEFMEDYMSGFYDRTCDECGGSGKVMEVDEDRCPPDLLAKYEAKLADDYEYEQMCAAERRMGC